GHDDQRGARRARREIRSQFLSASSALSALLVVGHGVHLNQLDAVETGSVTRNRVPVAALLYKSMRPSCASTIFLTIARPRPEPCGFVVKNGLKIRSVSSGGTPGPSSATSTTTVVS